MLYVRIIWKKNPTKVTNTQVSPEKLAEYQANLGSAWDDIETFTVSVNPIPDAVPEVKLHNIDINRSGKSLDLTLFDKNDKKVAAIHADAVRLQEFAIRVLQQTAYAFEDSVKS